MAKVNICNVVVKDNPCPFRHPFQFEITFECIENLNEGDVSAYICVSIVITVAYKTGAISVQNCTLSSL